MRGLLASRRLALACTVTAAVAALFAPPTQAASHYVQVGSFGDSSSIGEAAGIDVDQSSGTVYVANALDLSTFAPGSLVRFDASGALLPSFGENYYASVAVDQASHDVYGYGLFGSIDAYDSVGNPGGSFGVPAAFTTQQIAVDGNGDIYFPNQNENTVQKFDPAGNPVEFSVAHPVLDCSDCPPPASLESPADVAVDSTGAIYVVDTWHGRVVKFDSSGNYQSLLDAEGNPVAVAVDPGSDRIFVVDFGGTGIEVIAYDGGAEVDRFAAGEIGEPQGFLEITSQVAADSSSGKVYVTDPVNSIVHVFESLPLPVANTGGAAGVTQGGATLNATVNAEGHDAVCEFEWGRSTKYLEQPVSCSSDPVTGSSNTTVASPLSGLAPGTTYHYRVIAENIAGIARGEDQVFTTLPETCETNTALCPPSPQEASPQPGGEAPAPDRAKNALKCKKGFKKVKVRGKAKCKKIKKARKGRHGSRGDYRRGR